MVDSLALAISVLNRPGVARQQQQRHDEDIHSSMPMGFNLCTLRHCGISKVRNVAGFGFEIVAHSGVDIPDERQHDVAEAFRLGDESTWQVEPIDCATAADVMEMAWSISSSSVGVRSTYSPRRMEHPPDWRTSSSQ